MIMSLLTFKRRAVSSQMTGALHFNFRWVTCGSRSICEWYYNHLIFHSACMCVLCGSELELGSEPCRITFGEDMNGNFWSRNSTLHNSIEGKKLVQRLWILIYRGSNNVAQDTYGCFLWITACYLSSLNFKITQWTESIVLGKKTSKKNVKVKSEIHQYQTIDVGTWWLD